MNAKGNNGDEANVVLTKGQVCVNRRDLDTEGRGGLKCFPDVQGADD